MSVPFDPNYLRIQQLIERIGERSYHKRLARCRRKIFLALVRKGMNAARAETITGNIFRMYYVWQSKDVVTGNRLLDLEKLEDLLPELRTCHIKQLTNLIIK